MENYFLVEFYTTIKGMRKTGHRLLVCAETFEKACDKIKKIYDDEIVSCDYFENKTI